MTLEIWARKIILAQCAQKSGNVLKSLALIGPDEFLGSAQLSSKVFGLMLNTVYYTTKHCLISSIYLNVYALHFKKIAFDQNF